MDRRFDGLLAPPVLGALALLLANDFVLKPAYPGLLTGKLSDFAGLFLFAVFWTLVFPRRRGAVALATAAGFAFWKSPAAEPLIDGWNALPFLPVGRVVDPTDLLALLVLPLAYLYRPRPVERFPARRLLGPAVGAACIFAFAATSRSVYRNMVPVPDATWEFPFSREELLERIHALSLGSYGPGETLRTNRLALRLPAADSAAAANPRRRVEAVQVETFSTASGGSALRLLAVPEGTSAPYDTVRALVEREVVARIRANVPRQE